MVSGEGAPRLGIEGFPAEGGLLESILLRSRIYRQEDNGRWRFARPEPQSDSCHVIPAWDAALVFLEGAKSRTVNMSEIYSLWARPPFGIKAGLAPVIGLAFILANRQQLAFYREACSGAVY